MVLCEARRLHCPFITHAMMCLLGAEGQSSSIARSRRSRSIGRSATTLNPLVEFGTFSSNLHVLLTMDYHDNLLCVEAPRSFNPEASHGRVHLSILRLEDLACPIG